MEDHKAWLRAEIAQWLREDLISDDQAKRLFERYPDSAVVYDDRPRGRGVFALLGAVMLGLGVILLMAYNWEAMHRYSKLGVLLGGFVLSHIAALSLRRAPQMQMAFHLLGTMIFGASVWLIAQIYHLDRHYPDGFMFWAMAALLMAWLLPSVAHGLLAVVLICCWSLVEVMDFDSVHLEAVGLLLVGVPPLAYRLRSTLLLRLFLLALPLCFLISLGQLDPDGVLFYTLAAGAVYLCAEQLAPRLSWSQSIAPLYQSGLLLWWGGLLLLSFGDSVTPIAIPFIYAAPPLAQWLSGLLVAVLLATGAAALADKRLRPRSPSQWLAVALLWLPLLVVLGNRLLLATPALLEAIANLALLAYALLFIYRGTQEVRPATLTAGGGLLTLLTLLRFTDLFHSLLARAAVFLLLGLLLLLAGLRYSRQQERRKLEKGRAY